MKVFSISIVVLALVALSMGKDDCVDTIHDCHVWRNMGWCEASHKVRRDCRKTCRLCAGLLDLGRLLIPRETFKGHDGGTCYTIEDYIVCCPKGWTQHGGRCYQLFYCSAFCTHVTAREKCQTVQAELANCKTHEVEQFLKGMIASTSYYVMLGGRHNGNEGGWTWTDGTPFNYTNWMPNQPDNWGPMGEPCMAMKMARGQWNDVNCSYDFGPNAAFICEMYT